MYRVIGKRDRCLHDLYLGADHLCFLSPSSLPILILRSTPDMIGVPLDVVRTGTVSP